VKPQPPPPAPEPARPEEPPAVKAAPERERSLASRIRLSGGVGPGFLLDSSNSGVTIQGSNPVFLRGSVRASLDLMRLGPGDLLAVLPIAIQGASFRFSVLGFIVQGSIFGLDVMPCVRYQAEVVPDLTLYGEFGLGFGTLQTTIQQQFVGYQSVGAGGFGVRLGGGLEYRLLDQVRVFLQPMEVTSLSVTSTNTTGGTNSAIATEWSMFVGAVVPLSL